MNALEHAMTRQRREDTAINLVAFWNTAAALPSAGHWNLNETLHLRFHEDGTINQSFDGIAHTRGVTPNRARQVVEKALYLMRAHKRIAAWLIVEGGV